MSDCNISLCRLCRKTCDFSINIFNPNGTNGLLVWRIIKELLQLDVCKDDGLPVTICHGCMDKVAEFKYFKTMCITSRIEFLKASVSRGLVDSESSPFDGFPQLKYLPPFRDRDAGMRPPGISMETSQQTHMEDRKPSVEALNMQMRRKGFIPPSGTSDSFMPVVKSVIGSATAHNQQTQLLGPGSHRTSNLIQMPTSSHSVTNQKKRPREPSEDLRSKKVPREDPSNDSTTSHSFVVNSVKQAVGHRPGPASRTRKAQLVQEEESNAMSTNGTTVNKEVNVASGQERHAAAPKKGSGPEKAPKSTRPSPKDTVGSAKNSTVPPAVVKPVQVRKKAAQQKWKSSKREVRSSSQAKGGVSKDAVMTPGTKGLSKTSEGVSNGDLSSDYGSDNDNEFMADPTSPADSESETESDAGLANKKFPCPMDGCQKTFVGLKSLLIHSIQVNHPMSKLMNLMTKDPFLREELKLSHPTGDPFTRKGLNEGSVQLDANRSKNQTGGDPISAEVSHKPPGPKKSASSNRDLSNQRKTTPAPSSVKVAAVVSGTSKKLRKSAMLNEACSENLSLDCEVSNKTTDVSPESANSLWKCGVDGCDLAFGSKRSLSIHRGFKHKAKYISERQGTGKFPVSDSDLSSGTKKEGTHECLQCLQAFDSREKLYRHQRLNHGSQAGPKCSKASGKLDLGSESHRDVPLEAKTSPHNKASDAPSEEAKTRSMPTSSPSTAGHHQQESPIMLRECSVVLHDIMKGPSGLSLAGRTPNLKEEPQEIMPDAENTERTSRGGIMKYFPVISGVSPKVSPPSSCTKVTTIKTSKLNVNRNYPSAEKFRKSTLVGVKTASSDLKKPPSITDMFGNTPKVSSESSGEAKNLSPPKPTQSNISEQARVLGFKELTVSLCKLPSSPDALQNNLSELLGKAEDKESPRSDQIEPPNDHEDVKLRFKCDNCFMIFESKQNLRFHIKLQHGPKPAHMCDICKRAFVTSNSYKRHMRSHCTKFGSPTREKNEFKTHCKVLFHGKNKYVKQRRKLAVRDKDTETHPTSEQQNTSPDNSPMVYSDADSDSFHEYHMDDGKSSENVLPCENDGSEQISNNSNVCMKSETSDQRMGPESGVSKVPDGRDPGHVSDNSAPRSELISPIIGPRDTSPMEEESLRDTPASPVGALSNVGVSDQLPNPLASIPDDPRPENTTCLPVGEKSPITVPEIRAEPSSAASDTPNSHVSASESDQPRSILPECGSATDDLSLPNRSEALESVLKEAEPFEEGNILDGHLSSSGQEVVQKVGTDISGERDGNANIKDMKLGSNMEVAAVEEVLEPVVPCTEAGNGGILEHSLGRAKGTDQHTENVLSVEGLESISSDESLNLALPLQLDSETEANNRCAKPTEITSSKGLDREAKVTEISLCGAPSATLDGGTSLRESMEDEGDAVGEALGAVSAVVSPAKSSLEGKDATVHTFSGAEMKSGEGGGVCNTEKQFMSEGDSYAGEKGCEKGEGSSPAELKEPMISPSTSACNGVEKEVHDTTNQSLANGRDSDGEKGCEEGDGSSSAELKEPLISPSTSACNEVEKEVHDTTNQSLANGRDSDGEKGCEEGDGSSSAELKEPMISPSTSACNGVEKEVHDTTNQSLANGRDSDGEKGCEEGDGSSSAELKEPLISPSTSACNGVEKEVHDTANQSLANGRDSDGEKGCEEGDGSSSAELKEPLISPSTSACNGVEEVHDKTDQSLVVGDPAAENGCEDGSNPLKVKNSLTSSPTSDCNVRPFEKKVSGAGKNCDVISTTMTGGKIPTEVLSGDTVLAFTRPKDQPKQQTEECAPGSRGQDGCDKDTVQAASCAIATEQEGAGQSSPAATEQFLCAECRVPFTNKIALRNHYYKDHHKIWLYVCKCGESYKVRGWYLNHLKWHKRVDRMNAMKGRIGVTSSKISEASSSDPSERGGGSRMEQLSVGSGCKQSTGEGPRVEEGAGCSKTSRRNDLNGSATEKSLPELYCNKCMAMFRDKVSMRHHIFNTHMKRRQFWCHKCEVAGPRHQWTKHMMIHKDDIHGYHCKKCFIEFDTQESLFNHLKERHGATAPEFCDICKRGYMNKTRMKLHKCSVYSDRFKCTKCGKVHSTVAWYQLHVLMCHHNLSNHECLKCGKRVMTRDKMTLHKLTHMKTRLNQCPKCQKTFKYKCNLRRHERHRHSDEDHKGRKNPCKHCNKAFFTLQDLMQHMAVHTEKESFVCNICGAEFRYRSNLGRHKREIHEGKPLSKLKSMAYEQCNKCDKVFRHPQELKQHEGMHMKVWPFKCYVCQEPFKFRSSCYDHFQRHHHGVPWDVKMAKIKQE